MLSRPARSEAGSEAGLRPRLQVVVVDAATYLADHSRLGACWGVRGSYGPPRRATIQTTVHCAPHHGARPCASAAAARRPCGGAIRTTVSQRREDKARAAFLGRGLTATLQLALAPSCTTRGDGEQGDGSCSSSTGKSSALCRWGAAAKDTLAPALLSIPLQLSCPWTAPAAAVALATSPPAAPPPAQLYQNAAMQMMMQEDEQFMGLIFPGFDERAFIWQITCWQVAEFGISMLLGHNKANPTPCVLYRLGASWGPSVAQGQLWRLVAPVMLHANLTHLLFNVFFQLRMGFGMEKQFGREKMMLIYFACGLFGNLMSVCVDPLKLAVGASTAGFGLIGVWLAEILLSWEVLGPARERTIIWIVFMLVSVTTMSSMTPNMDLLGHFGGALGGFLLAILISDMRKQDQPEWYSQARAAAALGLGVFFCGGLAKATLLAPHSPIPSCPLFSSSA